MAAYNTLNTEIKCNNCGNNTAINLQFKFGDTWQFEYCVGDKIRWGGNDIGCPNLSVVKAYGLAKSDICLHCKQSNLDEYDIFIENDFIIGINPMNSYEDYAVANEGNFFIIKE